MAESARVAVVTGGARRVGRAIVERLAAAGFDVVLTYLGSEAEAKQTVAQVEALGRRAVCVRADLSRPEAWVGAIRDAALTWGRLDVLVNNASLYKPGGMRDASMEQWRSMWAVHVEAPLLLCRALETPLREACGHVVNMVDVLAQKPWPAYAAYCSTKAALWNLTLSLARELAPEVTVNGIAPGVVDWPEAYSQEQKDRYLGRVPLGRAGTPGDVAELVCFLCTAGAYVTGQIIPLDGGRSIT